MSVIGSNALAGASGQGGSGDYVIEKSLRFNRDDTAYLNKTFSSDGNRKTFTYSFWVKRTNVGASETGVLVEARVTGTPSADGDAFSFRFDASDKIRVADWGNFYVTSTAKFRDPSAWYHLVLSVDTTQASNNISLYVNGVLNSQGTHAQNTDTRVNAGSGTVHEIGARTYGSDNYYLDAYLADFHFVDGQALDPTSFGAFDDSGVWQAAEFTGSHGTNGFHLDFADGSNIGNDAAGSNNWTANNLTGSIPIISSPNRPTWNAAGAWSRTNNNYDASYAGSGYGAIQATLSANTTYHFYLKFKDAGASYGGWYFNSASSSPSSTVPDELGGNTLGLRTGESSLGTHGTYATANGTSNGQDQITVTALQSSGNGEHTIEFVVNTTAGKVWARKVGDANWVGNGDPSNSSSTASFLIPTGAQYIGYMAHSTSSTAAFTTQVGDAADLDLLVDSPTNGNPNDDTGAGGVLSSNYCTWNPLTIRNGNGTMQLLDGNLNFGDQGTSSRYGSVIGTIAVNSGKWFVECTYGSGGGLNTNVVFGLVPVEKDANYTASSRQSIDGMIALRGPNAHKQGSTEVSNYASGLAIGDTVSVAFDCDNGTSTWYKNGTSLGTFPHTFDTQYSWTPCAIDWSNGTPGSSYILNCGQRPFSMTPPTGYKAICTANLPTPTIADGSDYFDAVLYSGTGNAQSITGLGFSPDLVWTKNRGASASHAVYDSVRGAGELIRTNESSAEVTVSSRFTSFDSNGFSIGSTSTENNASSNTYVSWAWDAGGSTVSNTDGDITSSVRANTSAGFSIVKWNPDSNGQSVGHGLNAVPEFIMAKALDNGHSWRVYHKSLSSGKNLLLDTSDAEDTYSADIDTVSSTVFDGGQGLTGSGLNNNIAYCFTSVAGYSAFGSYTGNSSTDGPFVYTGFRPKWILIKSTGSAHDWAILDTARDTYNPADTIISPSASNGDATSSNYHVDLLSNGFRLKTSTHPFNAGYTYIYAAFAENPFQANGGLAR